MPMRVRRVVQGPGLWLVLLLVSSACNPESSSDLAFDFIDRFPTADVQTETDAIDFGTASARPHLLGGWSGDERAGAVSFVWAVGSESSLRLYVSAPRPLALVLRCEPFVFDHAPPQTIAALVNQQTVAQLQLTQGRNEYRLSVPPEALVAGENRITFKYGYARRPIDSAVESEDSRPLAVAWDTLRIEAAESSGAPRVQTGDGPPALVVPFSSRVDYYLKIPEGSELAMDKLLPWGGPPGADDGALLQVELQAAGAAALQTMQVAPTSSPRRILVPASAGQIARLSFQALPGPRRANGVHGMQLQRPTLRAARRPQRAAAQDCAAPAPQPILQKAPNVIIYLVDTLRPDHLGCYGYARPTSPYIDAFAKDAILFSDAVAQCSWTRPAVASIFTGLTPPAHHVMGKQDVLPPTATLASLLQEAGYETAAVVTNGHLAATFGMAQGFATYTYLPEDEKRRRDVHQLADRLNEEAFAWLDRRRTDRPFFLYLHATDPHGPYTPHSPFRERFAAGVADAEVGSLKTLGALEHGQTTAPVQLRQDLLALYDGEIAFVDEQFGELVRRLKESDLYDSTLVILVADHGEAFDDHDRWQHGNALFAEQIAIPLIVKLPGQRGAGMVVRAVAQQVDILPTVLDSVRRPIPPAVQGKSLLPLLACPDEADSQRVAYAYLGGDGILAEVESVIADTLKLIRYPQSDRQHAAVALYDRRADPREAHNLAAGRPVEVGYLRTHLQQFGFSPAPLSVPSPAVMDDALRERLRALGYLP